MREIKFRGKRVDNEQWVYGTYHYCTQDGIMSTRKWGTIPDVIDEEIKFNCHWILEHKTPNHPGWDIRESFAPRAVIPETVGQFINHEIGNEKSFEGDILKSGNGKFWVITWKYQSFYVDNKSIRDNGKNKFGGNEEYEFHEYMRMLVKSATTIEKIGTIHDNPELLCQPEK